MAKFKSKKFRRPIKLSQSKPTSRQSSVKPPPLKSFVMENVKRVGNIENQNITKNTLVGTGNDTHLKGMRGRVSAFIPIPTKQKNPFVEGSKIEEKNEARVMLLKERKSLHMAHNVLLKEYQRRLDVRKNTMQKFGRAKARLKMIMGQNKQEGKSRTFFMKENIWDTKKKNNETKQDSKKKRTFKVMSYDDPDKI